MKKNILVNLGLIIALFSSAQSNLRVAKIDSTDSKAVFLITHFQKAYILSISDVEKGNELMEISLKLKGNTSSYLIKKRVPYGESLNIRPYEQGQNQSLFIEIGSNVLYAHQIVFGKKIFLNVSPPLKGEKLNEYYNKVLKKEAIAY